MDVRQTAIDFITGAAICACTSELSYSMGATDKDYLQTAARIASNRNLLPIDYEEVTEDHLRMALFILNAYPGTIADNTELQTFCDCIVGELDKR